ncbi:MAG: universal stress protein [bacterium]|nr:universal stress protein [bacterium]
MADGHGIRRIALFIEGTEPSMRAARYAVALARLLGAELVALYVVDVKTLEDLLRARIFVRMEEAGYERDLEEDGRRYLNHVRDLAEAKGVPVETMLEKGEVHTTVVRAVRDLGADLLVMGEIETPRSRKDFYFDERERVFREARCPVLVVKGDEEIRDLYDGV